MSKKYLVTLSLSDYEIELIADNEFDAKQTAIDNLAWDIENKCKDILDEIVRDGKTWSSIVRKKEII